MPASGIVVPTKVKGWKNVLAIDFNEDVPRGQVIDSKGHGLGNLKPYLGAYPTGWTTSKPWAAGTYDNSILEVSDSKLIMNIHTDTAGRPRVAALRPVLPVMHAGRFSVCFRVPKTLPGYKVAWLLWPDSNTWPRDGEIDFPECGLDGNEIKGFMHRQDGADGADQSIGYTGVSMTDGEWHTATINWKSGAWKTPMCEFVMDGTKVASFKERVPVGPMHWVIQTEPKLQSTKPDKAVAGTIEIDWISAFVPS